MFSVIHGRHQAVSHFIIICERANSSIKSSKMLRDALFFTLLSTAIADNTLGCYDEKLKQEHDNCLSINDSPNRYPCESFTNLNITLPVKNCEW